MAIKQFVSLEGVEDVERGWDRVAKAGEAAIKKVNQAGAGAEDPTKRLVEGFQGAGLELDKTSKSIVNFREVFKTLKPVMQAAGLQVSEFGQFARIANSSLTAFAGVAAGAVIIALADLAEKTEKTKTQFAGLFGSREAGSRALNQLDQAAKELNTSVEGLAPAFQSATTALQRFQQTGQKFKFVALRPEDLPVGNIKDVSGAVSNLIKIIRAGGQDEKEAEKSAKAFFDTMKEGGLLTAEALKQMDPGAVRLIAEAMGRGAINTEQFIAEVALAPPTIAKVIEALAKFGPGAQKAFDQNAIKSWHDELSGLLADLNRGFKDLAGVTFSDFLIGELKAIRDGIKTSVDEFIRIKGLVTPTVAPDQSRQQAIDAADQLRQVKPFKLSDIFGLEPGLPLDAFGSLATDVQKAGNAAQTASPFWDAMAQSIKNTADVAVEAGNAILQAQQKGKFIVPPAPGTEGGQIQAPPSQPFEQLKSDASEAFDAIAQDSEQAAQEVAQDFSTPPDLSQWEGGFQQSFGQGVADAQSAYSQMAQIFSQPIKVSFDTSGAGVLAAGGGQLRAAGGGQISGPGSTTSDSIFAFLSNREWVINARAVDFYGSNLFAALNSMRLPRNFSMPKFAEGGQATSPQSSLTLVLGGRQFEAHASEGTVTALRRFAVNSQLASIGRKPGFVR